MITGVCDVQVAVNSLTAGAYHYITKPFLAQELAWISHQQKGVRLHPSV